MDGVDKLCIALFVVYIGSFCSSEDFSTVFKWKKAEDGSRTLSFKNLLHFDIGCNNNNRYLIAHSGAVASWMF